MEAPLNPIKIFAVSLVSGKKFQAQAAYDGERLVIVDVRPITGLFSTWKDPLVKSIEQKKEQGYIVLVEEVGESISSHGTQYLLEDLDDEQGKTHLQIALDAYFEMENMETLVISPECQQFALKAGNEGSWIEKKNDEKGRPYYSVEWKRFTGAHRAILLCVVAAKYEPLSERFLDAMWPGGVSEKEEIHPALRWKERFKAFDLERGLEFERQREQIS